MLYSDYNEEPEEEHQYQLSCNEFQGPGVCEGGGFIDQGSALSY